jgi:V/A-type H+/Na+-transporting ATPase subunit I
MSLFPAPMRRVTAVVLESDLDGVTKELLRKGVLHFVTVSRAPESWGAQLGSLKPSLEEGRIAETRRRIESFLSLAGRAPRPPEEADLAGLHPLELPGANESLDKLAGELQQVRERQRVVQQEILRLGEIRRQVELFGDLGGGLREARRHTFLSIQSGSVPAVHFEAFSQAIGVHPTVLLRMGEADKRVSALLVSMKRDDAAVSKVLEQFGWTDLELPAIEPDSAQEVGGEVMGGIDAKLTTLHAEQQELGESVQTMVGQRVEELERMWGQVRMNELYARIQTYFSKTAKTVVFTGWVPAERERDLDGAVRGVTASRCYVEWSSPRMLSLEEQRGIPVKLSNPRFLRPFQGLVENYSIPQYGTVDPTPLVAVAYLLMFGLMFGDVGHGAAVLLVGVLGLVRNRRLGKPSPILMPLLCWCGGAAMVSGALFGSYFGRKWLPPLWFDYHAAVVGESTTGFVRDIYGILTITIYFGVAVIGVGLALNWVNLVRRKQWLRLLLDKGGILGGWMYGAGVWAAAAFARTGFTSLPPTDLLAVMFGVPALLFLAKPPLEFFLGHGGHGASHGHGAPGQRKAFKPMTVVDFLMEWIVEILEVFSGYLANTLSFMRVAGLGIGHVSLVVAFTQIADMLSGGGPWGIGGYAVYVVGNVLIVGLEGLSAGIQSLRLNYYEFFTKYFIGDGRVYAPVSLRLKTE